jgi:heme exporter protein C
MQSTFSTRKSADTAISIITLVGLINLPIVKKSVDWWNTLHQPASISITGESSISNEMLTPLLLSMLGVYLFVFFAGLLFMKAEIASRDHNKEWFKKTLKEH